MPDKKEYVGAILMDLSKVIDKINYTLLVAKLNAYGFSKETPKLIFSQLKNGTQRVRTNKTFSSWRELLCGVAHGSVLGPISFNKYLNDLLLFVSKIGVCNFDNNTTASMCHKEIELAIHWFEGNYINLNTGKCMVKK